MEITISADGGSARCSVCGVVTNVPHVYVAEIEAEDRKVTLCTDCLQEVHYKLMSLWKERGPRGTEIALMRCRGEIPSRYTSQRARY